MSETAYVEPFESENASPAERAADIMVRYSVAENGLIHPADAAELKWFIERACAAAQQKGERRILELVRKASEAIGITESPKCSAPPIPAP